jgi:hypothetical protein
MTFKRIFNPGDSAESNRRSGLNRRWIKAPYDGVDRRTGKDRRNDVRSAAAFEARDNEPRQPDDIEGVLLANAVRLEAVVRILEEKGLISSRELADAIRAIQSGFETRHIDAP